MAKVIVIGVAGETDLWLADLEAGTVKPFNNPTGKLATATDLRKAGGTFVKNVDFAVAISSAKEVFSGHFDG